ncbi:hypothetical protein SEUCBS139899_001803 [Sporothrix eucalyptigena]
MDGLDERALAYQGRNFWSDFMNARPQQYENVKEFVKDLSYLAHEIQFYIYYRNGKRWGGLHDQVKIWHCLHLLDESNPEWVTYLSPTIGSDSYRAVLAHWQTMKSWDLFSKELIRRLGHMRFVHAKEHDEETQPTKKTPLELPKDAWADKQPAKSVQADKPVAEKKPAEEPLPDIAKLRLGTDTTTDEGKKKDKKETPASASSQQTRGTAGEYSGQKVIDGTNGSQESSKSVRFADQADTKANYSNNVAKASSLGADAADYDDCNNSDSGLEFRSADDNDNDDADCNDAINNGFADDVYEDGDEVDGWVVVHINGELRYAIPGYERLKKPRHTLISAPRFVIQNFFRQRFPGRPKCSDCRCKHPAEGYMLCSHCDFCHMGGDDECYHQNPHLRGTRPAKDKYKKSKEPETDSRPETLPTKPGKKMTEPEPETRSEAQQVPTTKSEPQHPATKAFATAPAAPAPQPEPAKAASASTKGGVEDMTASINGMAVVNTPSKSPNVFVFKETQDPPTTSVPIIKFDLVLRPKESKVNINGPEQTETPNGLPGTRDAPATMTAPVISAEPTSVPAPSSTPAPVASPAPVAAPSPVPARVKTPVPIPVPTALAKKAPPRPIINPSDKPSSVPAAPATTTPAAEPLAANGDGGVRLTEENLARVPHDKSHRRWASMSSLTTSSSGASLVAFRRRRTTEMKEAAQRKADTEAAEAAEKAAADKAAAEEVANEGTVKRSENQDIMERLIQQQTAALSAHRKALQAAQKAAAEKAAAEAAAAEEAAAKETALMRSAHIQVAAMPAQGADFQNLYGRTAEHAAAWEKIIQEYNAREGAAQEARLAAEEDAARIVRKKAKAARKRERQKQRRQEQEQEERERSLAAEVQEIKTHRETELRKELEQQWHSKQQAAPEEEVQEIQWAREEPFQPQTAVSAAAKKKPKKRRNRGGRGRQQVRQDRIETPVHEIGFSTMSMSI